MAQEDEKIQFEYLEPWNEQTETGDTGLSARLKWQRNFDKIRMWIASLPDNFRNLVVDSLTIGGTRLDGVADQSTPDSDNSKILTFLAATQRFLSKVNADVAAGHITFESGLTSEELAIFLNQIRVQQLALLYGGAEFGTFMSGQTGGQVDEYGNAEFESIRSRSYIMTEEMIVNRLQGQEGDTLYSDVDQIDSVTTYVDETDGSTHYILTLREKWDGYFTAQQYGNIVKGVVNTLAAKAAGVSDHTSAADMEHQDQDNGGNFFYTSWMMVVATHNTAQDRLEVNQIDVVLYGDTEVPARRNFEPCRMMTIARRGCYLNPYDYPDGSADRNSIIRRQRLFEVSVTDGRITKISGVNSPVLTAGNFGVTVGELPDFVKQYPKVRELLNAVGEHTDWLYAQGVVISNIVQVDRTGNPIPQNIYPTEDWVDGSVVVNPRPGYGIYFANKWNEESGQYETHYVTHRGVMWQCLQSQPVVNGGVATYYEPKWNSPYWRLVDGNDNLSIEFVSSKGDKFYQGYVDTVVTPHLYYGNVDISEDIANQYWAWTRETESGKTPQDESWDSQQSHHARVLHLTNAEMPTAWGRNNKAIFTCTVTVNDGKSDIIVQNQVIA